MANTHGITVALEHVGQNFFILIKAVGKLTHDDYEEFESMLKAAIVKVNMPKINIVFDAREFEGWEIRAAWDDFKLGLNYGSEFSKIALVGEHNWQEWASKIGSVFVDGEMKSFIEFDQAIEWIHASNHSSS